MGYHIYYNNPTISKGKRPKKVPKGRMREEIRAMTEQFRGGQKTKELKTRVAKYDLICLSDPGLITSHWHATDSQHPISKLYPKNIQMLVYEKIWVRERCKNPSRNPLIHFKMVALTTRMLTQPGPQSHILNLLLLMHPFQGSCTSSLGISSVILYE